MAGRARPEHHLVALVTIALLITAAGCSRAPALPGTDPVPTEQLGEGSMVTLRGVPTAQTQRLDALGDVSLLGDDSTMREALVGGDEEVVIAATMLRSGEMYSVELIVLNRRDTLLQIERDDVRVADADGNWLEPVTEWEEGDRHGLSSRRETGAAPAPVLYELDRERERELAQSRLLMNLDTEWGSTTAKRSTTARSPLKPTNRDAVERGAQPEVVAVSGTPVRVNVPAADGGAFWAYFRGADPAFPLTAVVIVEGRPIAFRFER